MKDEYTIVIKVPGKMKVTARKSDMAKFSAKFEKTLP